MQLLRAEVVCLVGNVIAQSHSQGGTEQAAIGHGSVGVPELDDVEVTLGRQGNSH